MRNQLSVTTLAVAIALSAGLTPANAAPSPKASCVAQLGAHGPLGSPGAYQRTQHDPTFGLRVVRSVAMLETCAL